MTPERWRRIEQLYHSALTREGDERVSYLAEACAGNDELRREVESLLGNAKQSAGLLDGHAVEAAARDCISTVALDLSGKRLGRYEVIARLGGGGMGEVYRARDTRLGRDVALKVLRPESVSDPERKRRFEQEARAASALNHPGIITIHDIDQAEDIGFIAMEYVPGKALGELIGRKGLPLRETLNYAVQIASALAAAHGAGIVHRDLKPGNVMVNDTGHAKVLDFGLAKLAEPEAGDTVSTQTNTGTIMGTVAYMSPEQAQGKHVDARSDIFSFGALLYEMLTGRRAFQGDSTALTLAAVLKEEPKPPGELVAGLPTELERLVQRCLRKEPERRFQHMDDVKVALVELKEEAERGKPRRALWRITWAGVPLLVAAVAFAAWFLTRQRPQPDLVAVPLTTYPGHEESPSFSPDGNQVAFSWNGPKQDNWDIYVKLIGEDKPLRLTNDPAPDDSPEWSPDGRSIAFVRHLALGKAGVFLISAIGGAERKLTETSEWCSGGVGWHPEGKWLAISEGSEEVGCGLYVLSVDTGEKRLLTTSPSSAQADIGPSFSPDGRSLAFGRILGWGVVCEVFVLTVDDDLTARGEARQLTFVKQTSHHPRWTPDGHEIVFSYNAGDAEELCRVPASGSHKPERLTFAGGQGHSPAISRRGNRLAYVRSLFDENVWRLELPGRNRKAGAPVAFLSSTAADHSPQYSPDGLKIAFISSRSGSNEVWVCAADGSNEARLTSMNATITGAPRWSPDGRRMVFDSTAAGNFDVYVMDAGGGRPQRLTDEPSSDAVASWSRDGRHIYFFSDRTSRPEVWRMPAEGGEAIQVTRDGGYVAFESMEGRSLYFSKLLYRTSLWRLAFGSGEERQVLESVYGFQFAVTEKGIYYEQPEGDESASLWYLNFRNGGARRLASIKRPLVTGFSVSPDERYVLYSQIDQGGNDLMLVENFR